jgi:predicted nucleotidyltransferase component of viral defense system
MITKEEIKKISFANKLDSLQVEKDYVLGWLLAGISQHPILSHGWIFKGGTCLRKIYFENYRYSEDLDYTISRDSGFKMEESNHFLKEVCQWVSQESGIEIDTGRSVFENLHNEANQNILRGKIYYRGPASPHSPRQWPRIKFDVTADEVVATKPEKKPLIHPYSDINDIKSYSINAYSMNELFSEKLRALFERTRPRDLYDVVEIYRRIGHTFDQEKMRENIKIKFLFKGIYNLDVNNLYVDTCRAGWNDQLAHQLHYLPPFEEYLKKFYEIFKILKLDSRN